MKAVLRAARPVHGDMSEIDPDAEAMSALPPNVHDNIVAILNRLVRDEIAHVDRKGAYLVDNVTVGQIEEARLFAALKPRSARALHYSADGGVVSGPRAYYSDAGAANLPRRRSGALRALPRSPEPGPMGRSSPGSGSEAATEVARGAQRRKGSAGKDPAARAADRKRR
jgi:hypothetical protein